MGRNRDSRRDVPLPLRNPRLLACRGACVGHGDPSKHTARWATAVTNPSGRAIDVPINVLDRTRARVDLGWSAQTPFEEGVRRAWEWMRTLPPPRPSAP